MKNRILNRIILAAAAACCAMCFTATPVSPEPVEAANIGTAIEPQQAVKEWIFAEMDNKLYKRLYNYSTGKWEGDWIYVGDL